MHMVVESQAKAGAVLPTCWATRPSSTAPQMLCSHKEQQNAKRWVGKYDTKVFHQ